MIALALILLGQHSSNVREEFAKGLAQIKSDWTKAQVQKVLGEPDDIWPPNDDQRYVEAGEEVWCYGTNGHHTLPTLGKVVFRNGRAMWGIGSFGKPFPGLHLLSEQEIRRYLRAMHRDQYHREYIDPLRLIQVANLLRPLGKTRAIALLVEYNRLQGLTRDDWTFWLARVLFDSRREGGVFAQPMIGCPVVPPPRNLRDWPRHPIFFVDDVPVSLWQGAEVMGLPESFEMYAERESKYWSVRPKTLHPPDDPFLIYGQIKAFPGYRSVPQSQYIRRSDVALTNILKLVSTAYFSEEDSEQMFQKHHQAFLKLHCRWSEQKQMYVRGDGSCTIPNEPLHPQVQYTFRLTGLKFSVVLSRTKLGVDYWTSTYEDGKEKIGNAVLTFLDAETGTELRWTCVNGLGPFKARITKEEALAEPSHSPEAHGMSEASGFSLPPNHRVKLQVEFEGKSYESKPLELK